MSCFTLDQDRICVRSESSFEAPAVTIARGSALFLEHLQAGEQRA